MLYYSNCTEFEPPFPPKDPLKGFPLLTVQILGFEFKFASRLELEHVIDILSKKKLPTTIELSNERSTGFGPNNHWLSRLPGNLKSWAKREKITRALIRTIADIEKSGIEFYKSQSRY